MKHLIIHDEDGYILKIASGTPKPQEPKGVPFLWADIEEGKQIKYIDGKGVDVSVTPHQVILEDIPLSEIEALKHRVAQTDEMVLALVESMFL